MGFKSMVRRALCTLAHQGTPHYARLNAIEERLDELELARAVDNLGKVRQLVKDTDIYGSAAAQINLTAVAPTAREIAAQIFKELSAGGAKVDARVAYRMYVDRGGQATEDVAGGWRWCLAELSD